jgi:hypothetical protein
MDITNEADLERIMGDILEDVIKEVSEKALDLLRSYILLDVYAHHGRNVDYYNMSAKPTLEFLHSWKLENIVRAMPNIIRELYQDWETMRFDEPTFLHGSKYNRTHAHDQRENLAEILNKDGRTSSLWLAVEVRPYWDNFIEDLSKGRIDQWFEQALEDRGVI